ncbi:GNAT family N-acetyltransferase [Paenibacillus sediminis]|uniref:Acetyltransferase n=1 Tax=Paenibacillus sediminis TaxID=664909 RepID=A0ABS4H1U2_9BACL|nr:GNAT family N-acetyltransferase [Paenibacillus sediminis]MBP1936499.1 putative acetyltransferase [Paenibacillus sediminis]
MDLQIIKAGVNQKEIIKNMMQFYFYDFSQFVEAHVGETGLFGEYPYLDYYWTEENVRFPYLVKLNDKNAGFVFVRFIQSEHKNYFSIAEFFIMKKYRMTGLGRQVAESIFDLHRGQWEVFQLEQNTPAQAFWNKVIDRYTKGQFTERFEEGRRIQEFVN